MGEYAEDSLNDGDLQRVDEIFHPKKYTEIKSCPFCGMDGFDDVGLKSHLVNGDCVEFNDIEAIKRMFRKEMQ